MKVLKVLHVAAGCVDSVGGMCLITRLRMLLYSVWRLRMLLYSVWSSPFPHFPTIVHGHVKVELPCIYSAHLRGQTFTVLSLLSCA